MKITKYEHACLDITSVTTRIVIDPGEFSKTFTDFSNIDALVITHIHADHYSKTKYDAIVSANPRVQIFTTREVAYEAGQKATVAKTSSPVNVGDVTLEFFGEKHAEIDPETPVVQNFGVLVCNKLYYPGDSFTECPKPFEILAVPSSAPWLRVGETIPLIKNSHCKTIFPTHNALLSELGEATTNIWLQRFAERSNKNFTYLKPSESIEV